MILLIWIACAVLCAMIAKDKGRDSLLAFFGGLFFGIFALVYIIVAPSKLK